MILFVLAREHLKTYLLALERRIMLIYSSRSRIAIFLVFTVNGKRSTSYSNNLVEKRKQSIFKYVEETVLGSRHLFIKLVVCVLKEVFLIMEYTLLMAKK